MEVKNEEKEHGTQPTKELESFILSDEHSADLLETRAVGRSLPAPWDKFPLPLLTWSEEDFVQKGAYMLSFFRETSSDSFTSLLLLLDILVGLTEGSIVD